MFSAIDDCDLSPDWLSILDRSLLYVEGREEC
jgi:hypothetical protein